MDLSAPLNSEPVGGKVRVIMVTPATLPSTGQNGSKFPALRLHVSNSWRPGSVNSVSHPNILSVSEVTRAEFSNFPNTELRTRPYPKAMLREDPLIEKHLEPKRLKIKRWKKTDQANKNQESNREASPMAQW